jgi:hypothetical protein
LDREAWLEPFEQRRQTRRHDAAADAQYVCHVWNHGGWLRAFGGLGRTGTRCVEPLPMPDNSRTTQQFFNLSTESVQRRAVWGIALL